MTTILGYVSDIFEALFTPTTGYISQVISLVTGEAYLMIGLALMIAGSAIAFLRRLIRST